MKDNVVRCFFFNLLAIYYLQKDAYYFFLFLSLYCVVYDVENL